MKNKKSLHSLAFTLIELLVVISIIGLLAGLAVPSLRDAMDKAQMTGTMSNAKQIQQAVMRSEMEASTSGDPSLGWPGDTGLKTVKEFIKTMVEYDMIKENDLKLFNAPGLPPLQKKEDADASKVAFKIFALSSTNDSSSVFLITKNHNGTKSGGGGTWKLEGTPYGDKGFVVCRKDGSAAIFRKAQLDKTNLFGTFAADVLQ